MGKSTEVLTRALSVKHRSVIPAQAGIHRQLNLRSRQNGSNTLDSRRRGNDNSAGRLSPIQRLHEGRRILKTNDAHRLDFLAGFIEKQDPRRAK